MKMQTVSGRHSGCARAQSRSTWSPLSSFGGLTIIANAPNPAGISLLRKHFDGGLSPVGLLGAALAPTAIMFVLFLVTR
jgi:hypothetical protein